MRSARLATSNRLTARDCDRVQSDHIHRAVERLRAGVSHAFGAPRRYEVVATDGFRAGVTAVFGLAATEALGVEIRPANFDAGEGKPCFRRIRAAGLAIVPIVRSE